MKYLCIPLVCAAMLVACDSHIATAPFLLNSSSGDVNVTVDYADGKTSSFVWKRCQLTSMGKPHTDIVKLQIFRRDAPPVSYGIHEVRQFVLEQERSRAVTAWQFDGTQLKLVNEATARSSAQCTSEVAR